MLPLRFALHHPFHLTLYYLYDFIVVNSYIIEDTLGGITTPYLLNAIHTDQDERTG